MRSAAVGLVFFLRLLDLRQSTATLVAPASRAESLRRRGLWPAAALLLLVGAGGTYFLPRSDSPTAERIVKLEITPLAIASNATDNEQTLWKEQVVTKGNMASHGYLVYPPLRGFDG